MHRADTPCGYSYSTRTCSALGTLCCLACLGIYISKTNPGGPLPSSLYPSSLQRRAGRQVETFPASSCLNLTRKAAPVSHNHSPHYPASQTLWLSSCMFHAWLESYLYSYRTHYNLLRKKKKKGSTDLKQLNFWLDRRFGSSAGFSALTRFQHLPGNRFSIHLYPTAVKHSNTGRLLPSPCSDVS